MFPTAVTLAGRCCGYFTLGPFVYLFESNAPSKKTRRAGTEAQESEGLLVSCNPCHIKRLKLTNNRPCKSRKVKWYFPPSH